MVDGSLTNVRWSRRGSSGWSSSRPYLWRDGVLVGGEKGEIAAFRPTDGSLIWADSLEGTIRGIGADGGRLHVGTLRGSVYAYDPPAGKTTP